MVRQEESIYSESCISNGTYSESVNNIKMSIHGKTSVRGTEGPVLLYIYIYIISYSKTEVDL